MKLIVANWKMNMTSKRIIDFFKKFNPSLNNSIVVICPSFPYICLVKNYLKKNMFLGAQNCHFENKGPFTGEVSAEMLKDLGVKYAIIGHSERRNNFNETNEVIKRKVLACLTSNIKPIICVGEIKPPRYLSEALSFIDKQLDPLRHGIVNLSKTIIAYEPVWAIGTGRAPDLAHLSRIIDFIRQ
ncbi:MAG: triose-phosphate isomerase, partial [Deltaproteobacteria bacterium]|nr:triose-phosphate isomerase [Deltaproteobacteria bacterium]